MCLKNQHKILYGILLKTLSNYHIYEQETVESYKKMQIFFVSENFKLSTMYTSSSFKQCIILLRLFNLSACSIEDHLIAVYYWALFVCYKQLLPPSNCLEICDKFPSSMVLRPLVFTLLSCCFFYLCNSKQTREDCRFSSGILLHSADWLFNWLIDWMFLSAIPLRNSTLRNSMFTLKAPKKCPKGKKFQITVAQL